MKLNEYIDHTLLRMDATRNDIKKLCDEAKEYQFKAICINPYWVKYASKQLKGSNVKICCVIGFPLGANDIFVKLGESLIAIDHGANELDFVMNVSAFKSRNYGDADMSYIIDNLKMMNPDIIIKIIIETCLLNKKEIAKACEIVLKSKADYIKTSTGFSSGGATIEDVEFIKSIVKDKMLIKASGGIKDKKTALAMIKAGANRIGTSNGVEIVK